MNLEISYEPDAEKITLIYDNCLAVTATKKNNGKLAYSPNMNKVEEEVQPVLKAICNLLMEME